MAEKDSHSNNLGDLVMRLEHEISSYTRQDARGNLSFHKFNISLRDNTSVIGFSIMAESQEELTCKIKIITTFKGENWINFLIN